MRGSSKSVTVGLPQWRLKLDLDSSRFMGHWEDPELPEMARSGHLGQPWACPLCECRRRQPECPGAAVHAAAHSAGPQAGHRLSIVRTIRVGFTERHRLEGGCSQ